MKNKFTSSVLHDGYIYGLDEAILACIDAATGVPMWKGGRYGYGQLLLADNHVIVLTEAGDVALVKASPERHQEIARFSAIVGKTWNHPVIAGGRLLIRNGQEMAAFDIRPSAPHESDSSGSIGGRLDRILPSNASDASYVLLVPPSRHRGYESGADGLSESGSRRPALCLRRPALRPEETRRFAKPARWQCLRWSER